MRKVALLGTLLACVSGMANAELIELDMSTWQTDGDGNWTYNADENSWYQSVNGQPTVLYDPNQSSINSAISGTISVVTESDDDFIGFTLGYNQGEVLQGEGADFWLVDWKKGVQGDAPAGLALTHVTEGQSNWAKSTDAYNIVARGNTLGGTGWVSYTDYTFDILYDKNLIEVFINDSLEMSVTAQEAGVSEFGDGAFGFYNFSQSNVVYSDPFLSPTEDVVSEEGKEKLSTAVPEPSSLAMAGLGIVGMGFMRRKRLKK